MPFKYTSLLHYVFLIIILSATNYTVQLHAKEPIQNKKGKIAIIIDDLGHKKFNGIESILLDIPLTVAILPFTPHAKSLAELAHKNEQDIILHLPMQPSFNNRLMTQNTLSIDMDKSMFKATVSKALNDVPHISGLNNHMGSLFTQLPDQMGWLMESMSEHSSPLFFVDSFTSERSIAYEVATQHHVPNTKRDIFLDRELDEEHMEKQITKMIEVANRKGQVVVIGHPFDETISLLKKHIPLLKAQGYEFIKVADLVKLPQLNSSEKIENRSRTNEFKQTIH